MGVVAIGVDGKSKLTISLSAVPVGNAKTAARQAVINGRITLANKQTSLGAMFKAMGAEGFGQQQESTIGTLLLLEKLRDKGVLPEWSYQTLYYALEGFPEASMVSWLDLAIEKPTLQSQAGYNVTLRQALDQLGTLDPPSADLLADVILVQQERFMANYSYNQGLLKTLATAFWRGFKKVIKFVVDETAAALGYVADKAAGALPWYVKYGVLVLAGVLVYQRLSPRRNPGRGRFSGTRRLLSP